MKKEIIEEIVSKYKLGKLKEEARRVTGGALNRSYYIKTTKGEYLIKELNPNVMRRKDAIDNHEFAESVSNFIVNQGINAVAAKEFEGRYVQKVGNTYFLIFKYIKNAKVLDYEEVTTKHCKKIGEVLAQIHKMDFSKSNLPNKKWQNSKNIIFDWKYYLKFAQQRDVEWKEVYKEKVGLLCKINEDANKAIKELSNNLVIGHNDLDLGNVLWKVGKPIIIDWESAGYISPAIELVEYSYCWAGGADELFDSKKVKAFLYAYLKERSITQEEFEIALIANYKGKLGWLEYNIKRALEIECQDEEENKLGIKETIRELKELEDYTNLIPEMKKCFKDVIKKIKKESKQKHYAYMLRCSDGSIYSGYTTDPHRRKKVHNCGKGAKYTKTRRPVELVYFEEFDNKIDAMKREYAFKQLTHKEKEEIIKNSNK